MLLVWVILLLLFVAVLVYGLAKQHLWLILGGRDNSPNPFEQPAR